MNFRPLCGPSSPRAERKKAPMRLPGGLAWGPCPILGDGRISFYLGSTGGIVHFTAPQPLTGFGRVSRSLLIVGLLIGTLFPPVVGVNLVSVASALAVPVVIYEVLRFLPRMHTVVVFVVPLFGLIAAHPLFVSPGGVYGDDKLSKFVTLTLVSALVACLLRDGRSVVTFARVWIVAALVLAVLSLVGWQGSGRAGVFESNPIWLGRALATGVLAALWLAWRKIQKPLPMMLAATVLLVGLLATGSRGPLVGVVVGAVVLGIVGNPLKFHRVATIAAAGGLGVIAVQTLPILKQGRLAQIIAGDDVTDQARDVFFDATIQLIMREPGGVGFGNWARHVSVPHQYRWPHNLFLEVFAELGVVVGVLLCAALVMVLIRLARRSGANPVAAFVLAALAAETFCVCVSGDLNARTFFFLLTLGFLVGSKSPLMGLDPTRTEEARVLSRSLSGLRG